MVRLRALTEADDVRVVPVAPGAAMRRTVGVAACRSRTTISGRA